MTKSGKAQWGTRIGQDSDKQGFGVDACRLAVMVRWNGVRVHARGLRCVRRVWADSIGSGITARACRARCPSHRGQ